VPRGVGTPAQFDAVPDRATNSPRLRPQRSVVMTVQPPAYGAGVVDGALDVRDAEPGTGVDLVVLDQGVAAAGRREHGHAVVVGRGESVTVVELGRSGPRDDGIAEALGEGENPGRVVDQGRERHV
jgi:hypothetical protein